MVASEAKRVPEEHAVIKVQSSDSAQQLAIEPRRETVEGKPQARM